MAWYGYKGPYGAPLAKLLNEAGFTDILICSGPTSATIWTERQGTFEERGERVKEAAYFLLDNGFRCTYAYMCPIMARSDAPYAVANEFPGYPMFTVQLVAQEVAV